MSDYDNLFDKLSNEEKKYILEKALEYKELLNLEAGNSGWNDSTDSFRHSWGSGYLSLKYNDLLSNVATSAYEFLEPSQPKKEKEMDLWNNRVGREIAKNINDEYPDIEKNINWSSIEDLLAKKTVEKMDNNELITSTNDARLSDGKKTLEGYVEYNKPISLKERLQKAREEQFASYTKKLAESPEKVSEQESKHVTLEDLKAPQEARKKRVLDIINGTIEFDEQANLSGYENKKSKDNKIFTKEDIEEMSEDEKNANKDAIIYQEQTIGIPTREQAEKATGKGSMVKVSSYTRADGTKVKSYYRSR